MTGAGGTIGEALVRNPITELVTLTGSVAAGEKIAAGAAGNLAAVSLELGGKAPFIVMDDVDVESAARHALTARFQNNGQVCTCNERTYVHRRVFGQFLDCYTALARRLKVGDPTDEATDLGPMVSNAELEKVEQMVATARQQGAEVVTGGQRAEVPGFEGGFWYEPTVLICGRNDMEAMQDEIFGPVSPIMAFDDFEEVRAVGLSVLQRRKDGAALRRRLQLRRALRQQDRTGAAERPSHRLSQERHARR